MQQRTSLLTILLLAAALATSSTATAADPRATLRITAGGSWQLRNDIQIPNSDLGTRFALDELVGSGPLAAGRLNAKWFINDRHGVRVMLAPLSYDEAITFDEPVQFEGETYAPDQETTATYKFNSWRVGYFYQAVRKERTQVHIGATLKVRDAEIRLQQNDTVSFNEDLGVVPLLYIAATHQLNQQWQIGADIDALGGGPGRAIDLGFTMDYSITDRVRLGAEVRLLDGGADIDELFNFALFGSAGLSLSTSF